ncbi:MAG: PAS domain S-box protein [Bacillota bacterium]
MIAGSIESHAVHGEKGNEIHQHNHICSIYQTKDEQMSSVIPFIKEGLSNKEKCIYIAAENGVQDITDIFRADSEVLSCAIEKGELIILRDNEAYLKEGEFRTEKMLELLSELAEGTKREGFSGLRVTGEASWIKADGALIREFLDYESRVNDLIRDLKISALCQYNINHFSPEILELVIMSHPVIIYQGKSCRNYHYVPPQEYIKGDTGIDKINQTLGQILLTEKYVESLKEKNAELENINNQLRSEIIARKETEEKLKSQQKLLKDVLELIPVGVWVIDKEGNKIISNKMAGQIWEGIRYDSRKDLEKYKGWWADTGDEIKPEEWASVRATKKGESSLSEEILIECFDGSKKLILNSAVPFYKEEQIVGEIIVNVDITEHKKREESIKLYQKRLQLAADHFNFQFCIFDTEGHYQYVNPCFCKEAGIDSDKIIGRKDQEVFPSNITQQYLPSFYRAIETLEPQTVEVKYENNLEERTVIITFIPITDEEHKLFQVISTGFDVTDLRKTEDQLRQSEELYRATFEEAEVGIAHVDLNGRFLKVNRKLASISGYTKEEMQALTFQQITHPDDLSDDLQYANKLLNGEIQTYQMEKRYIQKDGAVIWGLLTAAIVRDELGNPKYFIAIIEDIDSKKKNQTILQSTLEELKLSNKDLAQFAYVSSHDLQEPLRMISSYLSLLERRYGNKLDSTARTYMNFSIDGAKRMSEMIKDLLIYSRLSARAKPFEPVDINETVNEVKKELRPDIEQTNAFINFSGLPVVRADKLQIYQLFLNLIGNALKFCHGRTPVVTIKAERKENCWLFSVQDNGIGIEEEYFEKIFIMFQRLHTRDKYPGTGIGLTICKKIVEQHHGSIWVESEEGKGSRFYFTIADNLQ